MGAPNEAEIRFVPGVLIKNPINTTAPTYGGTILGSGRSFRVSHGTEYIMCPAEEFGRINRVFEAKSNPWAEFELRQWNADAFAAFFQDSHADGITFSETLGRELTTAKFLWAADRSSEPSVLIENAIVVIEDNFDAFQYSLAKELTIWIRLMTLPGGTLKMRPVSSLLP